MTSVNVRDSRVRDVKVVRMNETNCKGLTRKSYELKSYFSFVAYNNMPFPVFQQLYFED
jgi:hypothetical protein